jgi:hypothetical protein
MTEDYRRGASGPANEEPEVLAEIATALRGKARGLEDADVGTICSWVSTRSAMELVGSEPDDQLTPEILLTWVSRSLRTIVLCEKENSHAPLGFCTMSTQETARLPCSCVEICHLVVSPAARYAWTACRLIDAVRSLAAAGGFHDVVGRVAPRNTRMLIIAGFKGAQRLSVLPAWAEPGFVWLTVPAGTAREQRRSLSAKRI